MERVVITGLGVISNLGYTVDEFWNNLVRGESRISRIPFFGESADDLLATMYPIQNFGCQIGGKIESFDVQPYIIGDKKQKLEGQRRWDKYTKFAVAAAHQALTDAGLPLDKRGERNNRAAVFWGSGTGGQSSAERDLTKLMNPGKHTIGQVIEALRREGLYQSGNLVLRAGDLETVIDIGKPASGKPDALTITKLMGNAAPAQISMNFGIRGPSVDIATACSSAGTAMYFALGELRQAKFDYIIAGGSEAVMTPVAFGSFGRMKAMCTDSNDNPTRGSRPFNRDRSGFVMSEGAGALIFETYSHAIARGARIYAEVMNIGCNCDAFDITNPDQDQVYECIRQALSDKDGRFDEAAARRIGYVNAHGTSTPVNDIAEPKAVERVLAPYVPEIVISSTKSETGHLIGAAAAVEALICCKVLETGDIPPTINLTDPDPELPALNYVPNTAIHRKVVACLSNSFGFGGHNTCVRVEAIPECFYKNG